MKEDETKHQEYWFEYKDAILNTPQITLSRFDDNKGNRFYYWNDAGITKSGIGITSLFSYVMPESKFLVDWKLKWGDKWKEVLTLSSNYGTAMHTIFNEWLIRKEVPQERLDQARFFSNQIGANYYMPERDLLSFMKFCEDFKVKPLLCEGLLRSEQLKGGGYYCMAVDLVCEMTAQEKTKIQVEDGVYLRGAKKGQPKFCEETVITEKKVIACIDFKSNFFSKDSKSFFDSHHYQLIGAKKSVENTFGIKVDSIYNFAPNNWKSEPAYTLKEWKTSEKDYELFDAYVNLAELRGLLEPKGSIFIPPKFNADTKSGDYKFLSYSDYISK